MSLMLPTITDYEKLLQESKTLMSLLRDCIKSEIKQETGEKLIDLNYQKVLGRNKDRDIQIYQMLSDGKSRLEIAETIHLNHRSIEAKTLQQVKSFKCNNITHLISEMIRQKIIS